MGFITRHRIGGIHKEARAQTKLIRAAEARASEHNTDDFLNERGVDAFGQDITPKDEAYWVDYAARATEGKQRAA